MFSQQYRPKGPKQLIGNKQRNVAESLVERAVKDDFSRAIMLTGPTGTGKTTIARMFSEMVMCKSPVEGKAGMEPCKECSGCRSASLTIQEMNCSSSTGVDDIRDLVSKLYNRPLEGNYKVYILDEVHGLSNKAQNALLKPTEDVPPHAIFILITTEPEKIINTLKGRFVKYNLTVPSKSEQRVLVRSILKKEEHNIDEDELEHLVDRAAGNMRELVNLAEDYKHGIVKVISEEDKEATRSLATTLFSNRTKSVNEIIEVLDDIENYDAAAGGLVKYALVVLKHNNMYSDKGKLACKVIDLFGEGLNRNAIPKYSFLRRVLRAYASR